MKYISFLLQADMQILTFNNKQKVNQRLKDLGVVLDIPKEYGLKLPLETIEEVENFARGLDVNNLSDELGNQRNRRLELVRKTSFHY